LFFDLFTRFVTVAIAPTPVLPLRMPPGAVESREKCDDPQELESPSKVDIWSQLFH
jgi:hypothetical protein